MLELVTRMLKLHKDLSKAEASDERGTMNDEWRNDMMRQIFTAIGMNVGGVTELPVGRSGSRT